MTSPATPLYKRLLLTGAAGGLGRALRPRLTARCEVLRVSDLADLGAAQPGEEVQQVALQDRAAVLALLDGVNAVGAPFEPGFLMRSPEPLRMRSRFLWILA